MNYLLLFENFQGWIEISATEFIKNTWINFTKEEINKIKDILYPHKIMNPIGNDRIDVKSNNLRMVIIKLEDEWYCVMIKIENGGKFYKCDQFYSLEYLLKEKKNEWFVENPMLEEFERSWAHTQKHKHGDISYELITPYLFGKEVLGSKSTYDFNDLVSDVETKEELDDILNNIKNKWENFKNSEINTIISLIPYTDVEIIDTIGYISGLDGEGELFMLGIPPGPYKVPGRIEIKSEGITIIKLKDEWYYVIIDLNEGPFFYKCDQLDGLMSFLRKNI